ncbi:SPARC-like protein 1 isoform X2 [Microtus pennsylvanicus]|uniref:SPARC-like protein 1 isoform X2 n=1 Tax=Microtus pennsylvanicus TaxID=10058 RepID=UPI003F6BF805
MTPALFFLYILGTAAAIPAEQPSALKSEEENHEQSTEQDKAYSLEEDLKDEEDGEGDLSVNLDYSPTEGVIDAQDGTSEPPQQEKLPESTDFPEVASTSSVDSNPQANVTKGEGSQEQSEGDANQQLNKNNPHNQDLMDEESPEQDPGAPDEEEEEEEEEPGDVGAPGDNQEREKEPPEEQPISKQEGNSDQSDDPLEESSQPTQLSKTEKNGFEQGNQEQEGNSNAEGEDKTASSAKHIQHTEWQGQEGKAVLEATGSQKDEDGKTVSAEPTDAVAILASYDGIKDDTKHGTSDDSFIPSQELLEAGKADALSYYLKRAEQATDENEKVDKSEAGDNPRAKKAESSPNVEPSDEGNSRGHSADSCVNFQCKRGHTCEADQQGKPHCVCQDPETCPPAKILDQVCGTDNQTYASSCHLFATKCQLEGTKKGHQLQLDYFGACKSIPACTDFEVAQFPLRMRDWLKNILMQLYEPNPKHDGYLNEKQRSKVKKIYLDEKRLLAGDHPIELLLRDFKKNYHMYVYPVHWQFNELDQHPTDRILTHSELAPLRASLVPMEHCITRFFEECDPNKDKHITLKEWGHCFGIKEEDIDENLLF